MNFIFRPTPLAGVIEIECRSVADDRGSFYEAWRENAFAEAGLPARFVQDNHSRSRKGVLRGLHWQDMTAPLGKLVRCTRGAVWDAVVDLRAGSPTFGRWHGATLDAAAAAPLEVWVPPGFAHGFVALAEDAEVQYKVTGYWVREAEGCLAWNDPEVGIRWPVAAPVLNDRDRRGMTLEEYRARPSFRWGPGGEAVKP